MMRSFAVLAFIAAAAAAGIFVGMRRTVIDGKVMAAHMLEQVGERGITSVDCDPQIPVGRAGAVFQCAVGANDGSTARFEYTMNRAGALSGKLLESTVPTDMIPPPSAAPPPPPDSQSRPPPHPPAVQPRNRRPGADPWAE